MLSTASQRSRRLWLLDRHGQAIASDMRDGLGDWIRRRLEHCSTAQEKEEDVLNECGITDAELRHQWKLQRESQLSLRARSYPLSFFAAAVNLKHS
jgi:ferric-dicitrate binding protein FerR (iron transport regulator)